MQEQKINITISLGDLQRVIGYMQCAHLLSPVNMDDETQHIFNQLSAVFDDTAYGKRQKEEQEEMRRRYEMAQKIVTMDQLRAKRA